MIKKLQLNNSDIERRHFPVPFTQLHYCLCDVTSSASVVCIRTTDPPNVQVRIQEDEEKILVAFKNLTVLNVTFFTNIILKTL